MSDSFAPNVSEPALWDGMQSGTPTELNFLRENTTRGYVNNNVPDVERSAARRQCASPNNRGQTMPYKRWSEIRDAARPR